MGSGGIGESRLTAEEHLPSLEVGLREVLLGVRSVAGSVDRLEYSEVV